MTHLKNITVSTISILVMLVSIGGISFSVPLYTAHAQVVTVEAPGPSQVADLGTAAATTLTSVISKTLDGLAWTAAKIAIQSMTRSIVNWINSGFQGSPAFATDLNKTLRGVADAAVDRFIYDLKNQAGIDIETPFKDQIAQSLRNSYYRESANGIQRNYNLYQSSDNPQAFLDGQFKEGGFDAWFATTLNEDNNPLNSLFKAKTELYNTIANVKDNQLRELDWGNGFLSWRGKCNKTAQTTPVSNTASGATEDLSGKNTCLSYDIETPGSVIESALISNVNSPLHQLELADSINEIVSALMGQLVNQVLGPGGLLGASSPSSGGGSSPLERATDSAQYDSVTNSLASGFNQEVQRQKNEVGKFQSAWQTISTAADRAQTACGSSTIPFASVGTTTTVTLGERILQVKTIAITALTRASVALSTLDTLSSSITNRGNANDLTSQYQNFLSNNALPNTEEMTFALSQSQSGASSTSPTLYDQMTQAVKTCNPFPNSAIQ